MTARHWYFGMMVAVVLALLAGCGGSQGGTTQPAETAPAGQPAATRQPAAAGQLSGQTVRLGIWASPEQLKFFEQWVKPFQDQTGINVKVEYVDWETYWTKLPTQFSAGNAPDVIEMSNYIPQFGPQNVLADLNAFIQRDHI